MEDGVGIRICFHCLVKGLKNKRIIITVTNNEGNNATVIQIQNGAQIDFVDISSFVPFELRHIGQPLLVGCLGMEITVQYILCNILRVLGPSCTAVVAVLDGGLDVFLATDPQHPFVVNVDAVVMTKIIVDAAISFVGAFHVDLLDLFCKCLVFCRSGAFLAGQPAIIRCSGYLQHRTSFFDCVAAFFTMLLDSFIEMALPYLR